MSAERVQYGCGRCLYERLQINECGRETYTVSVYILINTETTILFKEKDLMDLDKVKTDTLQNPTKPLAPGFVQQGIARHVDSDVFYCSHSACP